MESITKLTDFLPFEVAPRARVDSFICSESACSPTGLAICDDVASDFMITGIRVGPNSQLGSTSDISGSVFAASARQVSCAFNPLGEGARFTVFATNLADTPKIWKADLMGYKLPGKSGASYLFGLGFRSCPPGGVLDILLPIQFAFSLNRLIIPSYINKSFVVKDVSLRSIDGHTLALLIFKETPAAQYGESMEGHLDTIVVFKPWHMVRLVVQNISDIPLMFTGAFVGTHLSQSKDSCVAIGGYYDM
jgi:hypothetical protein